MIKTLSTSS
jgi:hypothetical protein